MTAKAKVTVPPGAFAQALAAANAKPETVAGPGRDAVTNHPTIAFGSLDDAKAIIGDRVGLILFCPAPEGDSLPKSSTGKTAILGAARNGWGDDVAIGPLNTRVAFRWSMNAK